MESDLGSSRAPPVQNSKLKNNTKVRKKSKPNVPQLRISRAEALDRIQAPVVASPYPLSLYPDASRIAMAIDTAFQHEFGQSLSAVLGQARGSSAESAESATSAAPQVAEVNGVGGVRGV